MMLDTSMASRKCPAVAAQAASTDHPSSTGSGGSRGCLTQIREYRADRHLGAARRSDQPLTDAPNEMPAARAAT